MIVVEKINTNNAELVLTLKSEYNPFLIEKIKTFEKRKWDPNTKRWLVYLPIDYANIYDNRTFQYFLTMEDCIYNFNNIVKEIKQKYITEHDKIIKISKLSSMKELTANFSEVLSTYPIICKNKNQELKEFQKTAVYLIDYYFKTRQTKGVLLADDMGLGKTITTIAYLNYKGDIFSKIIIICPAAVIWFWHEKIQEWYVFDKPIFVNEDIIKENGFYLYTYNHFQRKQEKNIFENQKFDFMVLDEAHYIKNKSKRTSSILSFASKNVKQILALTGTPFENRPRELFNLLKLIQPEKWNFYEYVTRYCNAYRNLYGWDTSGSSNLEELNIKLRQNVMIRREKKEVLTFLKEKERNILRFDVNLSVNMKKTEKEIYELKEKIENNKKIVVETPEQRKQILQKIEKQRKMLIGKIAIYRRKIGLLKVPFVLELMEDILEQKDKVVIYAHHLDVFAEIEKYLNSNNIKYVKVVGDVSAKEKKILVDTFNNDKSIRVFLGGIRSASEGITLTSADTMIIAEFDPNPLKMKQTEDRCYRISQKNNVMVFWLSARKTYDDALLTMVIEKIEAFERGIIGKLGENLNLIEL